MGRLGPRTASADKSLWLIGAPAVGIVDDAQGWGFGERRFGEPLGFVRGPVDAPAWMISGEPVPYAWPSGGMVREADTDGPIALRPMFEKAMRDRDLTQRAEISVERARGPLLLLSGEADAMWPSTPFAELIVERVARTRASVRCTHLHYADAGHAFPGSPGTLVPTEVAAHPLTGDRYAFGSSSLSPASRASARRDSWRSSGFGAHIRAGWWRTAGRIPPRASWASAW